MENCWLRKFIKIASFRTILVYLCVLENRKNFCAARQEAPRANLPATAVPPESPPVERNIGEKKTAIRRAETSLKHIRKGMARYYEGLTMNVGKSQVGKGDSVLGLTNGMIQTS